MAAYGLSSGISRKQELRARGRRGGGDRGVREGNRECEMGKRLGEEGEGKVRVGGR